MRAIKPRKKSIKFRLGLRSKKRKLPLMCPQCHRPFSIEKESTEVISDQETEDFHSGLREKVKDVGELLDPLKANPIPYEKEVKVEELDYEYKYKCKHCGYEWTENKIREKVERK